jgi:thiamine-phosphate pyrophosphorylase
VLLYYITDRLQLAGEECARRERLLARIAAAARAGIDYVQLRERDLTARDLEGLAREAVQAVRESGGFSGTRVLINSRLDVALAAGADGVHLRASDLAPSEARAIWAKCNRDNGRPGGPAFVIAVSCHTVAEVRLAEAHGADFVVFAPVFEKAAAPSHGGKLESGAQAGVGVGLEALREACRGAAAPANVEGVGSGSMPVLALGGITLANAGACLEAGASGIAAIRLFQEHDLTETIRRLRAMDANGES